MGRPRLVLLDEPASGVNPLMIEEMERHIRDLNAEGLTFLVVEHDMNLVMRLCDPIVVLDHGVKIAEVPPPRSGRTRSCSRRTWGTDGRSVDRRRGRRVRAGRHLARGQPRGGDGNDHLRYRSERRGEVNRSEGRERVVATDERRYDSTARSSRVEPRAPCSTEAWSTCPRSGACSR